MNILQKILNTKKSEVAAQSKLAKQSLGELKDAALNMPAAKSFISNIKKKAAQNKVALISEVKKASPSKGIIKENFDPVSIAKAYEKAGASAISVLTDEQYFKGSIEYLKKVRKVVNIPILRKDFIIDPFQIYQTRLMGADMILLIAAALTPQELKDYYDLSKEIGLEVLIEVHDEKEMELALQTEAKLIGINNRNLETFKTDINTSINLIKKTMENDNNSCFISESGINNTRDIEKLQNAGISGILVGESLMRQEDMEVAIKGLLKQFL